MFKKILFILVLFPVSFSFAASLPFGQGEFGKVRWETRFNFPKCSYPGNKKDVWCQTKDSKEAARLSGIEDRLIEWVSNGKTKSVYLAYFSFSNVSFRKRLCEAARKNQVRMTLVIHIGKRNSSNVKIFSDPKKCAPGVKVIGRGKGPFGTSGAHLQHAKVFLTSESKNPRPLHLLSDVEREKEARRRTRFTSSSANLSQYGTSLHFENWLFLDTPTDHSLAQANLCLFHAFFRENDRKVFSKTYAECRKSIEAEEPEAIQFYAVPHGGKNPRPFEAMKSSVLSAESDVKVAIHRLTTKKVYEDIFGNLGEEIALSVLFDDDTFRTSKKNGGPALSVSYHDVKAYKTLEKMGADVRFLETNGKLPHLQHNKFIVVDQKILFQGAGNFTATALNASGQGNYEQFYLIQVPEIVESYLRAWKKLYRLSTPPEAHPVSNLEDRWRF